jgi:segregation and condensation protein B
MTNDERKASLEAIIYAADEPATVEQLAVALNEERLVVQASLDELVASYATEERGIEMRAVAGGYKLYTKPQHHDVVRRFIKSLRPPLRLTMPALETLAVISYKQPVTGPEIGEIRGVNTSGVLKTLLDKRLITTAGRKEVMGRPILYRTSKEFLVRFGLSDLGELPSLKEFEALAREALGSDEGTAQEETYSSGMAESAPPEHALDAVAAAELQAEFGAGPAAVATEAHATSRAEGAESVAAYESETSETEQAVTPPSETAVEDVANDALDRGPSTVGKDLLEEERAATSEGMPAGEVDESPKAGAASAGE